MRTSGVTQVQAARSVPGREVLLAWGLMAVTMLGWSTNMVVGKFGAGLVHPHTMAFWRLAVGSLVLAFLARKHLRRDLPIMLKAWKPLLLISALGYFGTNFFTYLGLAYTTSLNGLLLNSVCPVMVFAMSMIFVGERASKAQLLGVVVSLLGVVVIILRGDITTLTSLQINIGDPIVLIALISYCGFTIAVKLRPDVNTFSFMLAGYVPAFFMFIPAFGYDLAHGQALVLDWPGVAIVLWLALVPGIFSFFCFNVAVRKLGANRAGLATHLMPVFGSGLSITLLGEQFKGFHFAGVALIAVGLVLSEMRGQRRI